MRICVCHLLRNSDYDYDSTGCLNVTDSGLRIISKLPKLEKLTIHEANFITENGMRYLHRLKEFKSQSSVMIDDAAVLSIVKAAPRLRLLDVRVCNQVTKDCAELVRDVCANRSTNVTLRILITENEYDDHLPDCRYITPNLEVLQVGCDHWPKFNDFTFACSLDDLERK